MAFPQNPELQTDGSPDNFGSLHHRHLGTGTSSFLKGELVYLNSNVVTVLGAAGALTARTVAGQAQKDDGATAVEQPIKVITPQQRWKIKCTNNGTANYASAFTKGTKYGLYRASNVWYVDLNVTNQDMVIFLEPAINSDEATDGSASSWAFVSFIPSVCQLAGGGD